MKSRYAVPVLLISAMLFAQTPSAVEITAEPHHHLAFENAQVRVFKVEVAPHQATLMHWHRHDYVYVTLGATELSNQVEGKPPATLKLTDGQTNFSPGEFSHLVRDLANTPFRNVTIELLQDAQARKSPPPKWDEERALHVLDKGTQDVMFVKDGVRVAETELQPGGMLPRHHHAGPHLVVAVSDLDLRSEVEGKAPQPVKVAAGDFKWVPGGSTHTVMNVGDKTAKFVTLEFPADSK
jgi:quercetin dioxygenase-like cupin family protein